LDKQQKQVRSTFVVCVSPTKKGRRGTIPSGLVGSIEMQTAFGLFERGKQLKAHNSVPNLNLD
jgi:hypothetical protein